MFELKQKIGSEQKLFCLAVCNELTIFYIVLLQGHETPAAPSQ